MKIPDFSHYYEAEIKAWKYVLSKIDQLTKQILELNTKINEFTPDLKIVLVREWMENQQKTNGLLQQKIQLIEQKLEKLE